MGTYRTATIKVAMIVMMVSIVDKEEAKTPQYALPDGLMFPHHDLVVKANSTYAGSPGLNPFAGREQNASWPPQPDKVDI